MCSDLVACEVREYDRNGHNSIFFYCTERTPPPNLKYTVQIFFSKTYKVSCNVFTTDDGTSFGLFVEDHVKDDADTCEDVVERDADGYATQKVLSRTLNAQLLDAQRSKKKAKRQKTKTATTTLHDSSQRSL